MYLMYQKMSTDIYVHCVTCKKALPIVLTFKYNVFNVSEKMSTNIYVQCITCKQANV